MKKKIVVATFLLFLICVSVFAFVGCKGQTLQLLDVWQINDGSLVLYIKDIEEVSQEGDIEVSFDGGKTWKDTEIVVSESVYKIKKPACLAQVSNDDYGKSCNIAVRIINEKNKASKKSNVIEYYVKEVSKFNPWDRFSLFLDGTETDEYVFVMEDDKIVMKKYYVTQEGSVMMPVKEEDQVDIEYRVYRNEDVSEEIVEYVKSLDFFDDEEIEAIAYVMYILNDLTERAYINDTEYKDYDYQNGISKEEYGEGYNYEAGKFIFLIVRLKSTDTTLCSDYGLVVVEI